MNDRVSAPFLQEQTKPHDRMSSGIAGIGRQEAAYFRLGFAKPLLFKEDQSALNIRIHRSIQLEVLRLEHTGVSMGIEAVGNSGLGSQSA